MTWMHKTRLKVLAFSMGIALAALGVISLTALPAWPVVGVAVAAVALTVNRVAARLSVNQAMCFGCGLSIADAPVGEYGSVCPHCGAVNQPISRDRTA